MEKKFQVFISSTYEDLKDERNEIIKAVLEMGHIPVGMEMFSAADEEQWGVIKRTIDAIDYYAVVIAHRYGSVTKEGISYTEKEFDYAISKGIPVVGFIIDELVTWPPSMIDSDKRKVTKFKSKIKGKMVQFWTNKDDLRGKVIVSLMKSFATSPRTGWVRADEATSPVVTKELTRLSSENAILRAQIEVNNKAALEHQSAASHAMQILAKNKVRFKVRNDASWEEAKFYKLTLARIFGFVAPNLIYENSSLGVSQDLALKILNGPSDQKFWPVGKNQTAEIIADFAALDLVEPSKKKHQVKDTNTYWSLTKQGKKLLQEFRRIKLEEGLAELPDQVETGVGASAEDAVDVIPKAA